MRQLCSLISRTTRLKKLVVPRLRAVIIIFMALTGILSLIFLINIAAEMRADHAALLLLPFWYTNTIGRFSDRQNSYRNQQPLCR